MLTHSSFTHSLTYPPTQLLSLLHSITHPPTHSLTHSPTHAPTHPPTHPTNHPTTQPLTHFIFSFTPRHATPRHATPLHSLTHSLTHSITHSINSSINDSWHLAPVWTMFSTNSFGKIRSFTPFLSRFLLSGPSLFGGKSGGDIFKVRKMPEKMQTITKAARFTHLNHIPKEPRCWVRTC